MSATDRREAAIEAAARAWWDGDPLHSADPWDSLDVAYQAAIEAEAARIVDAVLALGCGCAERLEAEAQRVWHRFGSGALDAVNAYGDAAAFLNNPPESNPAGVNVTTAASTHPPPSSEGRPMTGAPLDADEAVPAPAGSPAEDLP